VASHPGDREDPAADPGVVVASPTAAAAQIAVLKREYPEVAAIKNILVMWRVQTQKQGAPNS
jgi:hypothetical protein